MKKNLLLFAFVCFLALGARAAVAEATGHVNPSKGMASVAITDGFVTTWLTSQDDESILIPINNLFTGQYNYSVDWGDGMTSTAQTGNATHTYATAGTHVVTITGDFPAIQFKNNASDPANDQKLRTVKKWGDGTWKSMDAAFMGCSNLTTVPNENGPVFAPKTTLYCMFYNCSSLNCDLNLWDLTNVREISFMFNGASSFNGNISDWNVSNVTNMQNTFETALAFNGDISKWDVSSVQLMDKMFSGAWAFNGDISKWNVGNVKNMQFMFSQASSFNQDIGKWNVSNVTAMYFMFNNASEFNQDLNAWDVSNVTMFNDMFEGANAFNGDISDWDVSHVTDMTLMFNGCEAFNQDLSRWDVSSVVNMDGMFNGASSFNQDISSWDVHSVKNMEYLFNDAAAFNQNIGSWQTTSLTRMQQIFAGAVSFNQNIENWDVSNVTSMREAFKDAAAFNQNLGKWDVGKVINMEYMLSGCGLSAFNYESTLNGWASKTLQPTVKLGAGGMRYCSNTGHNVLTEDNGWEITGDRKVCLVPAVPDAAGIVYVDSAVTVPGDGSSWSNALNYLSDAVESARTNQDIKEIHIAKGTYYPTGDKNLPYRDSTFVLTRPGLKVLGGYSNSGNSYDINLYPAVLSGDIGIAADTSDNIRTIMGIYGIDKGADSLILDGLTFTGGNAILPPDFLDYKYAGALLMDGCYANTVLNHCNFIGNYGTLASAIAILGTASTLNDPDLVSNPQLLNCLFKDNVIVDNPIFDLVAFGRSTLITYAAAPFLSHCDFIQNKGALGGAVSNNAASSPVFDNCTFSGNSAKGLSILYNYQQAEATFVNCLIEGNFNTGYNNVVVGEDINNLFSKTLVGNADHSTCRFINTTIVNNSGVAEPLIGDWPLIFNQQESATYMTNSIIWGNTTNWILDSLTLTPSKISYSIIQGLPADPLNHMQDGLTTESFFADTANGNFQLASPSPLINGGINDSLIAVLTPYFPDLVDGGLDLAENTRIVEGTIDLGAFEFINGPLPVSLAYFSGAWQGGLAALRWKSGVEEPALERYDVEKSVNGKDFNIIASRKASGSNSIYDYKTMQVEPTAYYRLKAIQSGGKYDYSAIAKVVRDGNGNAGAGVNKARLYPNPAKNYINVSVESNNTILIYNAAGSLVKSVSLKSGVNKIDISQLSAGAYFCKVGGQKLQFVKE